MIDDALHHPGKVRPPDSIGRDARRARPGADSRSPRGAPTGPLLGLAVGVVLTLAWTGAGTQSLATTQSPDAPTRESSPPAARDATPRRVVVVLDNGRQFEGELIDRTPQRVVLLIDGVRTPFDATKVAAVRDAPSIRERYLELRVRIGDDPDRITEFAEWLRAGGELGLALLEVERALEISPQHGPALRLHALIEQNIILRTRQVDPASRPNIQTSEMPGARAPGFPLLSDEQINLMRVLEFDLEEPGRILIDPQVVDEFIEAYRAHPLLPATAEGRDALRRGSALNLLRLMFRLRAREFYPRVRVMDDPPAMRLFREEINSGWLANSCATNYCHGGAEAGRLVLNNRASRSVAAAATNMLILERFRMADGRPLLDYQAPERSALLHLALPREHSLVPHPPVIRGRLDRDIWQPAFRSTRDRAYRRAIQWIASLYTPRPEYLIDYELPGTVAEAAQPNPDRPEPDAEGEDVPSGPTTRPKPLSGPDEPEPEDTDPAPASPFGGPTNPRPQPQPR